jgi:hypothetical protein
LLERVTPAPGKSVDPAHPQPYKITVSQIADKYLEKANPPLGLFDRIIIWAWLRQMRSQFEAGLPRFDDPYGYGWSRLAENVPTGPTRTQPFRTLIRQVLDRPGDDMHVFTKIATIFSEDLRKSAQFDGSIKDLDDRSAMAALAAGATVENMRKPEIVHNIRAASDFSRTLRPPRFEGLFPNEPPDLDPARVAHGREIYQEYCFSCHGGPGVERWTDGPRTGEVVPLAEIKTDPERVMFRHYGELPERLFLLFPTNPRHPFHFQRDQMLPSQADKDNLALRGYINAPLDGMFLRAPYLHNASVLTLAELINLKRRRDKFTRGDDVYDPSEVGFNPAGDDSQEHYFEFYTSVQGNSNKGHDYPWPYDDMHSHDDDLTALLAYLRTL